MSNKRNVIGIDLGGSFIKGSLFYGKHHIKLISVETEAEKGYAKVLDNMVNLIDYLKNQSISKIDAIGIGVPGLIDFSKQVVIKSPNFPDWKNVKLSYDIQTATLISTVIDNDVNVYAMGEKLLGVGKPYKDFFTFTLGTGVGGASFIDNKLFRGSTYKAGEVGHIVVEKDGRECGCGSRGCLEKYASATGVRLSAIEKVLESKSLIDDSNGDAANIDSNMVYQAALSGDPVSIEILKSAGRYIGRVISFIALLMDIKVYIIGGGLSAAFDLMIDDMRKEALKHAYNLEKRMLKIFKSNFDSKGGTIGALALALEFLQSRSIDTTS